MDAQHGIDILGATAAPAPRPTITPDAARMFLDATEPPVQDDFFAEDVPMDIEEIDEYDPTAWDVSVNESGFAGDEIEFPDDRELEDVLGDAVEADAQKIAALARQMNALKNPTVAQARALLAGAQQAIDLAAKKGSADRKAQIADTQGHLKWHADNMKPLAANAPYPNATDLNRWVLEAYIEGNLADEAATWRTWEWMWGQIGQGTADIAMRAADVAGKPFKAAEAIANIPWWGWAAGALVLGYGLVKIAPAVVPYAARRYL